jgi:GMP synthase (glutamine-hydrolysing)
VLGICYGMQLMADSLGGTVAPARQREFGHALVTVTDPAPLFAGVPRNPRLGEPWRFRGDAHRVSVIATSANAPVAAMTDRAGLPRCCFIRSRHTELA